MPENITTKSPSEPPEMPSRELTVAIGDGPGFPALVDLEEQWNGWLCPRFDRVTAQQAVDWLNRERATAPEHDRPDYAHATWAGDTILLTDSGNVERIEPDADGRYAIGAYSWCWERSTTQDDGTTVVDQSVKVTTLTALQVSALRELRLTDRQVTLGATVATFHMPARDALALVTKSQQQLGLTHGTARHPYRSLHGVLRKLRTLAYSADTATAVDA